MPQWIDVHNTPRSVAAKYPDAYASLEPGGQSELRVPRTKRQPKGPKPKIKPWKTKDISRARRLAIDYFLRMHGPVLANGCLEWQGPIAKTGYGTFNIGHRRYSAHRFAYQYHHKVVLESDQFVCHACDNRKCISLEHLWIGTHQENMRDMILKGRAGWQKKRAANAMLQEAAALDEAYSARAAPAGMPRLVKRGSSGHSQP